MSHEVILPDKSDPTAPILMLINDNLGLSRLRAKPPTEIFKIMSKFKNSRSMDVYGISVTIF